MIRHLFLMDIIKIMQYCLCEKKVNNIGQIQVKIMSFEKETGEELYKIAKHREIQFSYYYSSIIEFDKSNINVKTTNK